jgi:hypothetical protein
VLPRTDENRAAAAGLQCYVGARAEVSGVRGDEGRWSLQSSSCVVRICGVGLPITDLLQDFAGVQGVAVEARVAAASAAILLQLQVLLALMHVMVQNLREVCLAPCAGPSRGRVGWEYGSRFAWRG